MSICNKFSSSNDFKHIDGYSFGSFEVGHQFNMNQKHTHMSTFTLDIFVNIDILLKSFPDERMNKKNLQLKYANERLRNVLLVAVKPLHGKKFN